MTDQTENHDTRVLFQTDSLKVSEDSLRWLTDNMHDVITQIGPDGTILYVSSSHKMSLLELRREQRTLELEKRRRDNSTIWVEIWLVLLLDEQDKPRGIAGDTRDLTNVGRRRVNCACSTQNWKDA